MLIKPKYLGSEKFLGRCKKDCTPDFDTTHHLNNYTCPDFKKRIRTYQFEVKIK